MVSPQTLQVFLSQSYSPGPGIYEVSSVKSKGYVCTCPGFESTNKCKHVKYVNTKAKENGGKYPLPISRPYTDKELEQANKSPEAFRKFILMHGRIETC